MILTNSINHCVFTGYIRGSPNELWQNNKLIGYELNVVLCDKNSATESEITCHVYKSILKWFSPLSIPEFAIVNITSRYEPEKKIFNVVYIKNVGIYTAYHQNKNTPQVID